MKKAIGAIIAVTFLFLGIMGYFYQYMQKDIIYPNITVNDLEVGEMSKESAKLFLQEKQNFKSIIFRYKDKEYKYNLNDLGFVMDYDKAMNDAFGIGRSGSLFVDFKTLISLKYFNKKQNVILSQTENLPKLMEEVAKINSDIYAEPKDASISIENNYAITPEIVGQKLDLPELEKLIEANLKPNEDIVITLPIKTVAPNLTAEKLQHINGKLGEFSTSFNRGLTGRTENIKVATGTVNSTILMPGDEFSFNKKTGDRGLTDGYKEASVIINGKYEKGVAGGVCQVSTTLYNAALYAGLDITRRQNHSIPAAYVSIGRDAAVVSGDFDLRFKNPYEYPVLIKGYVSGNRIFFQIHGDINQKKSIQLSSETISRIPKRIIYRNDPTLPTGKQVVEEPGRDEIRSVTYMTVNGERKIINRDRYPGKTEIVRKGTGPAEHVPNLPSNTESGAQDSDDAEDIAINN